MRYESGCVNVVNVEERDVWGCCCNLRRGSRRKDVQGPRQIWRVSLVRILRLCSIPFTLWVPEIAERKRNEAALNIFLQEYRLFFYKHSHRLVQKGLTKVSYKTL